MIVFTQKYQKETVRIVLKDDCYTWPEVADRFVYFLQACGYIVRGSNVAQYLMDQYAYQIKEQEKLLESEIELPKKKRRKHRAKKR